MLTCNAYDHAEERSEPHPGVADAGGVELDRLDVDDEEGGRTDEFYDQATDDYPNGIF